MQTFSLTAAQTKHRSACEQTQRERERERERDSKTRKRENNFMYHKGNKSKFKRLLRRKMNPIIIIIIGKYSITDLIFH
jgi:hypothetical protein